MERAEAKVVVVTGASEGLGRSLALEASRRGARVALLARRRWLLEEICLQIEQEGGQALVLEADVGREESVERAFRAVDEAWGRVDILLNNAGLVGPLGPLSRTSPRQWLISLRTNVFGVYLTIREALRRMEAQPEGGTIINLTSGAARSPYAGWSAYCSHKAAVDMITRCVALEVEGRPIRIAALSPGPFESRMQRAIREASLEDFPSRQKFIDLYEQGLLAHPDSVARKILDIAFSRWPSLSGVVADLRSEDFQRLCLEQGIDIRGA